ncbi:uncharacterized protein CXorf38 homolog isoform X2 [Cottoperca gobio]|uniref:Uncharacterized protein CXorf38 homolog isoform X2 n=1 Tax=Cottoperca gobio TaxID=56716 RepID=A0A6J2RH17_COTGO|nr:uncharacterized protein CXorf38 homolog isoform X2 [Cottoperca gobio]
MVREELAVRLNDRGYKNWLKAGRCLLILKDGLHPFITQRMKAFHGDLLNQNTLLRKPCETSSCKPRGNKLSSTCSVCSEWQTVILRHHRQPDVTVNWENCFLPNCRTDHWELAKAYMPRGQRKVKGADQCDASALLNLINYCDSFQSVDPTFVREMLTVDLSIFVSGLDRMDSAVHEGLHCDSVSQWETSADLISQWEAELLQERLQELLHAAADAQDTEQLKRLRSFLQANRDLSERFSSELQAINSLESRE